MSTNSSGIVCIGAATLDAVVSVPRPLPVDGRLVIEAGVLSGGGPAATAAVTLARQGVPTAFLGRVGSDVAGSFIREGLAAEGVDVSGLRAVGGAGSAFSAVLVDPTEAERLILVYPGSCPPWEPSGADLDLCRAAQWVHVDQTGWPVIRHLRSEGIQTPVSVDGGNPIPDLDLSLVALYAPAEPALRAASGADDIEAGMAWALNRGAQLVVVTRGAQGSVAMARFDLEAPFAPSLLSTRSGQAVRVVAETAHPAPMVSTLGAGDVFHGALLAYLGRGHSVRVAMRIANVAAALSCAGLDGRSAIPRRQQLDAYLD